MPSCPNCGANSPPANPSPDARESIKGEAMSITFTGESPRYRAETLFTSHLAPGEAEGFSDGLGRPQVFGVLPGGARSPIGAST
jgi:hypothetical protein